MRVIAIILGLLFGVFLLLTAVDAASDRVTIAPDLRGRIALAVVMVFAASGHFVQTEPMAQMLPPRVPTRVPIIYATGFLEVAIAAALLVPRWSRPTGVFLILYLIAIFPSNVYAAFRRVPMGGHADGPKYLWMRAPLQLILIAWTWCFAVAEVTPFLSS